MTEGDWRGRQVKTMGDAIYTRTELAKRWKCHENTIIACEEEGKLHRLPNLPGVRYSAAEVYQLESIGPEAEALSPWERRQLQNEMQQLREENEDLKQRLMAAQRILIGVTA